MRGVGDIREGQWRQLQDKDRHLEVTPNIQRVHDHIVAYSSIPFTQVNGFLKMKLSAIRSTYTRMNGSISALLFARISIMHNKGSIVNGKVGIFLDMNAFGRR